MTLNKFEGKQNLVRVEAITIKAFSGALSWNMKDSQEYF
jgi:hypothetical protein